MKEYHHQNLNGLCLFRIKGQELGISLQEVHSCIRYIQCHNIMMHFLCMRVKWLIYWHVQVKEHLALQSIKQPLLPIYDNSRFKISEIEHELTFKEFCEQQLQCDSTSPVFLESGCLKEDEIDRTYNFILKGKVLYPSFEVSYYRV